MWARTIEFMLGVWLGISWIIFKYTDQTEFLMWNDFACFILISCFSLLSYAEKLRHLHLMNFVVGAWLAAFSYYVRHIGLDPSAENYMTLALLLLIFSIIPTHARRPPYQWIKYMDEKKR